MNHKIFLKPMAGVKNLMLTCSGGHAQVMEGTSTLDWGPEMRTERTAVRLGGEEYALTEEYIIPDGKLRDCVAHFTLEFRDAAGHVSMAELWAAIRDGEAPEFRSSSKDGLFYMLKPSEFETVYHAWFYAASARDRGIL